MASLRQGLTSLRERFGRLPFRHRLILLAAGAVATAVVLSSVIGFFVVRGELRAGVDRELRDMVREIAVSGRLPSPPPSDESDVFVLPRTPLGGPVGYAQIVQPDGTVILPRGGQVALPISQRTLEVASGSARPFFNDETINGVHARIFTTRIPPGITVQAVQALDEVDRSLRHLALALVLVSLGGIALAVWLGRLVAGAALRPVARLSDTAVHVAKTRDLSRRMDAEGTDELSRLGASFNSMMEALESSQRAQRQLVADASHELRTPLTSLRTNVEVLADADSLSPDDRRRLLRDVMAQLEELTVLVSALVDLARGDEPEMETEEVRLDLLVADAVERARRHAPDVTFETSLEPCWVRGVPPRLDRAVSNLLDNAAKWSPPGGTIEVGVRDGEVSVRDHGPGIEKADLPFVFDRFYRAPSARHLPGSGLGLAIVRQVAESHGGRVGAEAAEGGGALLMLRLPTIAGAAASPEPEPALERAEDEPVSPSSPG